MKAEVHPHFEEQDLTYLRGVCPEGEFEDRCMVALRLTALHKKMDKARGQATGRAKLIKWLEREAKAVQLLLGRRRDPGHERMLRMLRQGVHVELHTARNSPRRGAKNALDIAATLIVDTFRRCGLTVDTSKHEHGAVAVLALICWRAGMPLSPSSYKSAIRNASRG